jgi:hypothetical protein
MTTEEVTEMMDAIHDGREYKYVVNDGEGVVHFTADSVTFSVGEYRTYFEVMDSRTIREISAGLITWANYKGM